MFTVLAAGSWSPAQVRATWRATSSRLQIAEVDELVAVAWAQATGRPGIHLFDGPMCRLEAFQASDSALALDLSPTSYKVFLGTNLTNPAVAVRFGRSALANPVGMSAALVTADDFLLMGQRNANVAYYPERIHPFAGALEPKDVADPFGGMRRELAEEVSIGDDEVTTVACIGLAEDDVIRQPELFFSVTTSLTCAEVEGRLDLTEHRGVFALPATREGVEEVLRRPQQLTPVGAASLVLWGRGVVGEEWFTKQLQP